MQYYMRHTNHPVKRQLQNDPDVSDMVQSLVDRNERTYDKKRTHGYSHSKLPAELLKRKILISKTIHYRKNFNKYDD